MSSAQALVRFEDGTILYGIYHGTSDIMCPGLVEVPGVFNEPHRSWCHGAWDAAREATDPEPVEVYSRYGSGHRWTGTASRSAMVFLGPHDPWEDAPDHESNAEPPAWAKRPTTT